MDNSEKKRLVNLKKQFKQLYGSGADVVIRSPGRAEIIGNHTDYNHGFALSACISNSFIALFKKRKDDNFRIFSTNFSKTKPLAFNLDEIQKDEINGWVNYAKGVIKSLLDQGYKITNGADILIDSDIPVGAGVSSSAAYELAIAFGMGNLNKFKINPMKIALLCQQAENKFVNSPCGFLDQGSIAFGKAGKMVFMDFKPKDGAPVSSVRLIPSDLGKNCCFVVAVDKTVKRELGTSGYPARRKMCEESLLFWNKTLNKKVTALRDVTTVDFKKYSNDLNKWNPVMRKRVEHVVYENERVLEAIRALRKKDIKKFGMLLTESGKSALSLFELDEKTPELTFLFNEGQKMPGVIGIRNMGGGFSAVILALVENKKMADFQKHLSAKYKQKFGGKLEFIEFKATGGVGLVNL